MEEEGEGGGIVGDVVGGVRGRERERGRGRRMLWMGEGPEGGEGRRLLLLLWEGGVVVVLVLVFVMGEGGVAGWLAGGYVCTYVYMNV